jgi:hypothetical protein
VTLLPRPNCPGSGVARTCEPLMETGEPVNAKRRDVTPWPSSASARAASRSRVSSEVTPRRVRGAVGLGEITLHVPEAGSAWQCAKSGNPYCLTARKPDAPTV